MLLNLLGLLCVFLVPSYIPSQLGLNLSPGSCIQPVDLGV
ncbi:hypothetical protein XBO1_800008 [Xenorhabdus bovienii str. oregonense]|uniref:Uncharacterized protein n=1 Tax=Xenorhabdus bovienii str. oregonense TaxID=1398202 RepID=A0A077PBC2_XENBV|nr:hypothetical protein XBO1_800008 [Xenorhabdus bovienii str. oregonense]